MAERLSHHLLWPPIATSLPPPPPSLLLSGLTLTSTSPTSPTSALLTPYSFPPPGSPASSPSSLTPLPLPSSPPSTPSTASSSSASPPSSSPLPFATRTSTTAPSLPSTFFIGPPIRRTILVTTLTPTFCPTPKAPPVSPLLYMYLPLGLLYSSFDFSSGWGASEQRMGIDLNTIKEEDEGEAAEHLTTLQPLQTHPYHHKQPTHPRASPPVCLELWHACVRPLISLPRKGTVVAYLS